MNEEAIKKKLVQLNEDIKAARQELCAAEYEYTERKTSALSKIGTASGRLEMLLAMWPDEREKK